MSEKPIGIAIVICERVITEEVTGNKTLVSTFNNLQTLGFPVRHEKLSVYVALTNCTGSRQVSLTLTRDGEKMVSIPANIEFKSPLDVVELIFNLNNVLFLKAGLHAFEIHSEGEFIFESRFNVVQSHPQ